MRTRHLKRIVSITALAVASLFATRAAAAPYSDIYFFGDSVSDAGNVALAIGQPQGVPQLVTGNSYIPDYPYYPTGRYSNGPVWAEDFAGMFGLSATPSLAGGNDFAFAGARTGGPNVPAPTLTSQVDMYLGGTGGTARPDALYVIAEVGNDARDALAAIGGGADPAVTFQAASQGYATDVANLVDALRDAGATQFLVFDNVNLGLAPAVTALGSGAANLATTLTASMNLSLYQRLDGEAGVRVFDTFSFLTDVVENPGAHGFTNATDACAAVAAADCSTYVFWDGLHPTAALHELIAASIVPEAPSLQMLVVGLVALALVGRRARRHESA